MGNRLKDVFSNDIPEYKFSLKFKGSKDYRNFCDLLNTVEQDGCCVNVEGVDAITTYMKLHGVPFPIEEHKTVSKIMIGPTKEPVKIPVVLNGREKIYQFFRYTINTGVVIETDKNVVVYMKLVWSEDTQKVTITYRLQYEYAKTTEEIVFEINAFISFITKAYDITQEKGTADELSSMNDVIRNLMCVARFFSRLNALEKTLDLTFSTKEIDSMTKDEQQDIEELYLLLCKKVPLRLNATINTSEYLNVESQNFETEPIIGKEISLVFVRELTYDLLGKSFSIYTANALINVVVKDIQKNADKTTIYYGDIDSRPMYISFSGFLSEDQAKKESNRNIGGETKYINARTVESYIKEYYDVISN